MNSNLEQLIKDSLSPKNEIRKSAEDQLNSFLDNMTISNLDNLFKQLIISQNENIKMYIIILIKKFIEEKINENNKKLFMDYFSKNKNNILNLLISNNQSIKIINMLIISLCSGLSYFKEQEDLYTNNIYDIFSYFSQYYISKKQTQDIKGTILCLFICKKFIKFMKKVTVTQKLETLIKNFYTIIIEDYNTICNNIINNNNLNNNIILESLAYFYKLFKHSTDFIDDSYSDKILNKTYDLNAFILNNLISNNIKSINQDNNISKSIIDIILLSNKIIILYISRVMKLSIQTIKKYADMFYIYIKEESVFNYIQNILKNAKNISEFEESKFLMDIINFFYELLQLSSLQEFTELQIFGNGLTDNAIEISDYFRNNFWDHEKFQNLLVFILKNYLAFKPKEIMMGQEEPEDFYLWFCNSDSFQYDLRGKAGRVCRLIYDIYRKEIKDIYASLENDLYSLTEKEYNLLQNNQTLNDNQLNIKCALLSYYYYVDNHFGSKKLNKHKWFDQILLSQIEPSIILKKKNEIFSTFLIMYILTKINSYCSDSKIKYSVFMKVMNVFLCPNFDCFLLNLSSIDFIYDYVDEEIDNIELPKNLINNYLIKICYMLEKISSPDIHNKIIQTTNYLLKKASDDQLNLNFPVIFPILQKIWENNSIELNKNKNKIIKTSNKLSLLRSNLLKLIGLFVKKVGIFISFDNNDNNIISNNNINQNFCDNYFNFIFQIIGYSLSVSAQECEFLCKDAFNLVIFIQDNFIYNTPLSMISDINELNNPITSYQCFPSFLKTYNYLDILLSNLSNSNQYFILQFSAIEQFISLSFCQEISNILDQINFVEKIIYVFNYFINNYINEYSLFIFNIIEYIYYILLYHSKINQQNKKKFNEYFYNLIQNKLSDNNFENNIKRIINDYEKNNNDISSIKKEDINLIDIYLGIIQLANRYIFINASIGNVLNNDINIFIANKIIFLSKYISNKHQLFNILQKTMLQNCIFNLKNLINENLNKSVNINLNTIYNDISKSHFLSKNDKTLNHWLYFFNKMYNEFYLFNFNSEEYKLKYKWKNIIEKDVQQIDSISKDYKIKFLMLSSDKMYNNEE